MKEFFNLLRRFVRPYRKYLALTIGFNFLSALLNIFSFSLIIPILQILFKISQQTYEFMPWGGEGSLKDIAINNFYYFVTHLIGQLGESTATTSTAKSCRFPLASSRRNARATSSPA